MGKMMNWTKEPWVVFPRNSEIYIGIGEETGDGICDGGYGLWRDGPERKANAERIVACVNAMAGIDDPVTMVAEIEDVLTRVAEHLDRYSDVNDGDYGEPEANKEMLLLSAIKPLLSRMGGGE